MVGPVESRDQDTA